MAKKKSGKKYTTTKRGRDARTGSSVSRKPTGSRARQRARTIKILKKK